MKEYFPEIIEDAKAHALKEFPKESCGIVVDGKYIPCKNKAPNPEEHFSIGVDDNYLYLSDRIQCIIHSHNDSAHASKQDMIEQELHGVPWGIVNIKNGTVMDVFFWGDQLPIQDYIGRPFYHGVYDCYALVRDYFRGQHRITLPRNCREYGWWRNGENILEEGLFEAGFEIVGQGANDLKIIKENDGVLAKVNSTVVNHCGVYVGNDLLLHHLCLRKSMLSRHDPINIYRQYIYYIVRHKEFK